MTLDTLFPSLFPEIAIFKVFPVDRFGTVTHNRFQNAAYNDPLIIEFNFGHEEMFLFIFQCYRRPFAVHNGAGIVYDEAILIGGGSILLRR